MMIYVNMEVDHILNVVLPSTLIEAKAYAEERILVFISPTCFTNSDTLPLISP